VDDRSQGDRTPVRGNVAVAMNVLPKTYRSLQKLREEAVRSWVAGVVPLAHEVFRDDGFEDARSYITGRLLAGRSSREWMGKRGRA